MLKRFFCTAALVLFAAVLQAGDDGRVFDEVPFNDVHADDNFWAPRIKTNAEVSAAHNIDWCANQTGRIQN